MVHHQHNCIFVHIPKTAGKSITHFLGKFEPGPVHRNIFHYRSELDNETFNKYYKFAVVRNPWDKMVSEFFFQSQRTDGRAIRSNFIDYLKLGNRYQVGNQLDLIATPTWVWDPNKEDHIIKHENTTILVDEIFFFENLDSATRKLAKKFDIQTPFPLLNKSDHKAYQSYYNDESYELVRKSHLRDINYFNYKF